jgi:hypothetical protein
MRKRNFIILGGKTFYTINAISDATGYCLQYLRRLAREGKIVGTKIGANPEPMRQRWVFNKSEVLEQLGREHLEDSKPRKLWKTITPKRRKGSSKKQIDQLDRLSIEELTADL